MFTCPNCDCKYLVGQGWLPPPCIFKSSHTAREIPNEPKCLFCHIECQCGQYIGVKVISGPRRTLGYWRMQFEGQQETQHKKKVILIPKLFFSQNDLKQIYEKQLREIVDKTTDVQVQNTERIFLIKRVIKILVKRHQ